MFTQFFGNFLLSRGVLSTAELVAAMKKQADVHLKLGTIAIHEGLLTASEVDNIIIMQTHQDKKFGELAIENGYLTEEQVNTLLDSQKPDYLLIGQILIEEGKLTNADFENLISDYQSQNEILDLNANVEQKDIVKTLLQKFCEFDDHIAADTATEYLTLLFNNLIRFIGNDFTLLDPIPCEDYPTNYCIAQHIAGKISIQAAMDMHEDTAVAFASRYAKEAFEDFSEYAKAALEDFLNLHNGLFNVNMSNSRSIELSLCPPEVHSGDVLDFHKQSYIFPAIFSFGTVQFIVAL